jgi:protein phosphatase
MKHVLTRCLGNTAEIEVDAGEKPIDLEPEDTLVLCSDGLWNLVSAEEIQQIAAGSEPSEAAPKLVALARSRGGDDNITVEVARVRCATKAESVPGQNRTKPPRVAPEPGVAPQRRA